MIEVSRTFFRLLRGKRSQRALSQRLGYLGNPVVDWEGGRRFPSATETLRVALVCGADLAGALRAFQPEAVAVVEQELLFTRFGSGPAASGPYALKLAPGEVPLSREGLGRWLRALQGTRSVPEVAETCGASRFAVGRWLRGQTEPRTPQFFKLLDALTGRLADFLGGMVDAEALPVIGPEVKSRRAIRQLIIDEPWSAALLQLMYTEAYRRLAAHDDAWCARRLGLSAGQVGALLSAMRGAGVVRRTRGRWVPVRPLTIDTRGAPHINLMLKRHWAGVAADRIAHLGPHDLASYNILSCSEADLARIRELLIATFHEVRAIVASSECNEVAALLQLQLLPWTEP